MVRPLRGFSQGKSPKKVNIWDSSKRIPKAVPKEDPETAVAE
jgi:hypothetical protein